MNPLSYGMQIIRTVAAGFIIGSGGGLGNQSTSTGMIHSFGTFISPDATKKVIVSRRSATLVDFQVCNAANDKELAKDYIGSDVMRWFLYWESHTLLWGYGSDIGYFKLFEFRTDGTTKITPINDRVPIPQTVWDNLPSVLQKRYKVAPPK